MTIFRYTRWDGSQAEESGTQELMDQLSRDILEGDSLRGAMRRLMERGAGIRDGQRGQGMRDLMNRLREARERNLERYNLNGMMDDIKERLDQVLDKERKGIQQRLDDMHGQSGPQEQQGPQGQALSGQGGSGQQGGPAGDESLRELLRSMADKHVTQLDKLPPDVGGSIKELRDYDFMDPEARQQFQELLETLQKQVLENYFKGMQQGLENMTQENLKQVSEMVRDLNELAKQKLLGEAPDITEFMEKWGHFFPPGIENFDQLVAYMEEQMAQMQSLMNSMSPDQRSELQNLMDGLLQDNRLQWDMFELAQNMARLNPDAFPDSSFSLTGDEPVSMQEALELMGELNSMDTMEEDMIKAIRSNDPSDLDSEEIGRLLGEESKKYADELKRMIRELEEAGFVKNGEHGMELTPKAIRKIGEKALDDIFRQIRGADFGDHQHEKGGVGVELMDETKKWVFGDPLHLNAQKTISNAVIRQGKGTPVRITPDDFEINYTTNQVQSSTVIALDMSYSMMWSGYFQAGQRVGLALDTLIRTKYPKDNVTVLAFSYFVLPLESKMLLDTHWIEYGGGTNFQEVLRYARQVLKRQNGTKQIVLITDGEPTTYNYVSRGEDISGDPMEQFERMYSRRSKGMLEETLREVVRCTRDHITINTFMLDRDPGLLQFVKQMSTVNHGRAFVADPDQLGSYVVADYFSNRNKVIT